MIHIEEFSKDCSHCITEEERHYCECCKGTGQIHMYYKRYCSYDSRFDCEWGGDCEYCPDSERIDDDDLKYWL